MRFRIDSDNNIVPESFAIAGGRVTYNDGSWQTNYYITDHLGSVRAVTDANGNVLAEFDYIPYGELLTATDNTATGTDHLFTGKEQQGKLGASELYDSQARFMNTTGRFLSMDPLAEKYYHLSPYAYCAGDPVNLVDPDGRIFTDSLAKYVSILKNDINAEIQKLSKNESEANAEKIAELYQALTEFDEMEKSIQLYDIDFTPGSPFGADPDVEYYGWTEYNLDNDAVVIKISVDRSDVNFNYTLIHELKHAYQFETGYFTFYYKGTGGGSFYDYTDEEEAFRRSHALGNKNARPDSGYDKFSKMKRPHGKIVKPYTGKDIVHPNFR